MDFYNFSNWTICSMRRNFKKLSHTKVHHTSLEIVAALNKTLWNAIHVHVHEHPYTSYAYVHM